VTVTDVICYAYCVTLCERPLILSSSVQYGWVIEAVTLLGVKLKLILHLEVGILHKGIVKVSRVHFELKK
jgi:hypothetical protein